jgi:hypothetical protein
MEAISRTLKKYFKYLFSKTFSNPTQPKYTITGFLKYSYTYMVSRYLVERQLVERHLVERHLVEF